MGGAALAMSVLTFLSCEFLSFERDSEWDPDLPIFEGTGVRYYAGLFQYRDDGTSDGDCKTYTSVHEKFFSEQFIASQICGMVAVYTGGAAMLINLLEFLVCSFPCSFLFAEALFTGAAICQGCTFLMYGQPEFW